MTGHVFHPGHAELHGVTVVLETDGALFVGRYHEETPGGVLLHDVAELQAGPGEPSRVEFIERTRKFGVRATRRHLVVPGADVRRIVRLGEWSPPA